MYSVRASRGGNRNIDILSVAEREQLRFMSIETTSNNLNIFAAGLVIGLTAGFVGLLSRRPKMRRDVLLLTALTAYFCRNKLWDLALQVLPLQTEIYIALLLLLVINGLQVLYLYSIKDATASPKLDEKPPSPLKPLIFPASTSHIRFFPRHHSFKYSYLLVGVPVGWRGNNRNLLSSDLPRPTSWWKDAWLSVQAADHLLYTRPSPGSQAPSLREKLDAYLRSEDVNPALYPHAYLVTAPRVLGFTFNPVSFWYLYGRNMVLEAIILEVNNTFGERRMYLLQEEVSDDDELNQDAAHEKEILMKEFPVLDERRMKKFKSKWNKDFHVSPFNDRGGVYSLDAIDPFGNGTEEARVNNIITLSSPPYDTLQPEPTTGTSPSSSETPSPRAKIVASIVSTSTLNPTILSVVPTRKYAFLVRHMWIGFLTNPRILGEAWTLWMKGLRVWYRPEVYATTVGREETQEETVIEEAFERWLRRAATRPRMLSYVPAAGERRRHRVVFKGSAVDEAEDEAVSPLEVSPEQKAKINGGGAQGDAKVRAQNERLEIKILTPAFYSELIRTPDFRRVWEERCLNAKEGEAMVWTSDQQALEGLIDSEIEISSTEDDDAWKAGDEIERRKRREKWYQISPGIGTAPAGTYGYIHRGKGSRVKTGVSFADIINSHASSRTSSPSTAKQLADFNRASVHIHFADSHALGSTGILRFYGSVIYFAQMWMAAKMLSMVILNGISFGRGMECDTIAMFELYLLASLLALVGTRSFWRTEYTYS